MARLRQALRAYLLANHPDIDGTELSTILTGGIFDAQTTDASGVDTSWLPMNGARIMPFAVIRLRGASGREIIADSERRFVEIYFYADSGYDVIDAAKERVKAILHRKQVQADNADISMFHWDQDRGELPAPEYHSSASDMSRFYVDYLRK